jgi:hypothetical protein
MFLDGWMNEWMDVKAVLRIAYSNQKSYQLRHNCLVGRDVGKFEPPKLLYFSAANAKSFFSFENRNC